MVGFLMHNNSINNT